MSMRLVLEGGNMADHKEYSVGRDEPIAEYGAPFFTAMTDVNRVLFEQAVAVNTEWTGYLHRCLNESVSASQALMSANSTGNVVEIWSNYVRTISDDYRDQCNSLARGSGAIAKKVADVMIPGQ
jgi:hypothetical protein